MLDGFIDYHPHDLGLVPELETRNFLEFMRKRRTVREFSRRPVDRAVLLRCIEAAGTAPSGANSQPWFFALIESSELKARIRSAAEKIEEHFYHAAAPERFLADLRPLGTNESKPYLTEAPALILVFSKRKTLDQASYYPIESTGIATGILITALHHAGLVAVTHTPNPMSFLNEVLGLDSSFRPHLIVATGHAHDNARVPDLGRKSLGEICRVY